MAQCFPNATFEAWKTFRLLSADVRDGKLWLHGMTLNHPNQVILCTIHSAIPADQKQSFEKFQRQMNEACLKFQGNREQSISFDEMDDGERFTATTCTIFLGQCLYWLDSPERRHLLYQVETLVNYHYHANLEADSVDQWIQMKGSKKFRYGK